jgi:hypothetical protein
VGGLVRIVIFGIRRRGRRLEGERRFMASNNFVGRAFRRKRRRE